MKRRIIINITLAMLLLPAIAIMRDYIKLDVLQDHSMYSGSYADYFSLQWHLYVFEALLFLVLVLLPYNLIIVNRKLTLLQKFLVFECVLVVVFCIVGTTANVWYKPYWKNLLYLLYFVPYSLLFAGMIHGLVDRRNQ